MQQSDKKIEFKIELLKERIYATLALLAVLVSLDPSHTSVMRAELIVGGTAVSLWLASLVAAQMSHRIVTGRIHTPQEHDRNYIQHAPLLLAAVFPVIAIAISATGIYSLSTAVNIAIGSSILLMISWSLLSARALRAKKFTTLAVTASQLLLGLLIVAIKLQIEH